MTSITKFAFLFCFLISSACFAGNKRIMEQEIKKLKELNKKVVNKVLEKENIADYNNKTVYIKAKIKPKKNNDFDVDVINFSTKKILGEINSDEAVFKADIVKGKVKTSTVKNIKNLVVPKILQGEQFLESTVNNKIKNGDVGVPK